jgi:RNA polymerase sigma-70 factor (ECF subfamily)
MSIAVDDNRVSVDRVESIGLTDHSRQAWQDPLGKTRSTFRCPSSSEKAKPRTFDHSTLTEIIRRAQSGDSAAFEIIYRKYSSRVYALCLRMVRETREAEDLTQEAFLQLFRKIHTFRGESAFSTWLHRLTANIVLMHFRKKKLISSSLEDINATDEDHAGHYRELSAPDLRLTGLFDRVDLQTAIDRLPEGCKAMFLLHDVQGYDHNEIAEILGCSIGNSKSQLHRARIRLRKLLSELQCRVLSQNLNRAGCPLVTGNSQIDYESAEAA